MAEKTPDTPPQPRRGFLGLCDRLIGPEATHAEIALILTASLAGAAAVAVRLSQVGANGWLVVIGAALGFDLIGGVVANATSATKRWYHRPGSTIWGHVIFLLPHVGHVALVAWLFLNGNWRYFVAVVTLTAAAAGGVLVSPARLKCPVAVGLCLAGMGGWYYLLGPTLGLEWFVPALLLKLVGGHLVPDGSGVRAEPHAAADSGGG